tara:strand:+ start:664 stop:972 length:309 start_codon:yes stop_codon:yes gene_type:complete
LKKVLLILIFLIFSVSLVLADSKMELGLEVYNNKAQCGSCHTLKSADSNAEIGPNLNQLKPLMPRVVLAVTNGIGVMPSFKEILTPEEIEAVSYFVSSSANE